MKKDSYIYPAIFEYEEEGISISFPDLPGCFSCADTDEAAYFMAKEAMGLHLKGMEADSDEIPEPTSLKDIKVESNQKAVLIQIDMPAVRKAVDNVSIKKTLTIPQWLNTIAVRENVNFSQVLQEALKDYLNIKEKV
jgi:predicted RNase H-like HicB family nuclease